MSAGSESDSSETENEFECSQIDIHKMDFNKFKNTVSKLESYRACLEILVNHGRPSPVWKYFGTLMFKKNAMFPNRNFCKPCLDLKEFKLKPYNISTSTNVLKMHLVHCHNILFEAEKKNVSKGKQLTLTNLLSNKADILESNKKNKADQKNKIARKLALMCALDFEPFSISEKRGFVWFCESNGITNLPTGRNIGETALNDVYILFFNQVKKLLSTAPADMSIILDCWTDNFVQRPYISIKIHFCKNFQINVVTIKTGHFPRPHTAERIQKYLGDALSEFNLEDKRFISITDNGSNIISALKRSNIQRLPCVLHNISLFINTDILQNEKFKKFKNICSKLKKVNQALSYKHDDLVRINAQNKLIKFLKVLEDAVAISLCLENDNQISQDLLEVGVGDSIEEELNSLNNNCNSLKNSNITRWNSTLYMIESFCENATNVNIALGYIDRTDLVIGPMERSLLLSLKNFLEIFQKCSNLLQGLKYPTLNLQILFLIQLKKMLTNQREDEQFDLVLQLYDFSLENIEKRFIIKEEHVIASILDPSQKNLQQIIKYLPSSQSKQSILIKKIKEFKINTSNSEVATQANAPNESEFNSLNATTARISILSSLRLSNINDDEDVEFEVDMYFNSKSNIEIEPLDWWKQHQTSFPNLSKLAMIYLGIPASSSSSEMAFSTAGNFLTAKRSRLHPSKLNQLCFIHDNFDVCDISLIK